MLAHLKKLNEMVHHLKIVSALTIIFRLVLITNIKGLFSSSSGPLSASMHHNQHAPTSVMISLVEIHLSPFFWKLTSDQCPSLDMSLNSQQSKYWVQMTGSGFKPYYLFCNHQTSRLRKSTKLKIFTWIADIKSFRICRTHVFDTL